MNKSTYFVVTIAVSCIGAGWWLAQTQLRPGNREAQEELHSLRRELEALQEKMQGVDRRTSSTRWLERVAHRAAEDDSLRQVEEESSDKGLAMQPNDLSADEAPTEAEQQANYLALVNQAFTSEPRDPAWRAQSELESSLRAKLPAESRIESIECRSTLCRLITSHRDEQSYQSFVARAFLPQAGDDTRAWSGSAIFDGSDGSASSDLRTTTYLVRENHALPTAGIIPDEVAP